jgi:hypothetical protein
MTSGPRPQSFVHADIALVEGVGGSSGARHATKCPRRHRRRAWSSGGKRRYDKPGNEAGDNYPALLSERRHLVSGEHADVEFEGPLGGLDWSNAALLAASTSRQGQPSVGDVEPASR